MISIEKLKRVTIVYAHAHCPDGLASAMILKDAFRMLGTSPRIEFLVHGTKEHAVAGRANTAWSLFCDFAPSYRGDEAFTGGFAERTLVLDHHVGARETVESFGENGVYADAEKEPGVSGAVLAYREVWGPAFEHRYGDDDGRGAMRPDRTRALVYEFAACVGLRDTWQTREPAFINGQWISKMLMSKPASYWLSNRIAYLTEGEIANGRALFEAHEEAVRDALKQCVEFPIESGEYSALLVFQEQASGFRLCSDVAEALRAQNTTYQYEPSVRRVDVVAGFSYVVDKPGDPPRLLYSLLGLNGFDVCAFAKANGGGGHKAAAGFSVALRDENGRGPRLTDPYEEVRCRLVEFLNREMVGGS